MSGYRRVAELMKALAHPVRLQIVQILTAEGEACVCHLEARLGQRQAYISQQLSKLREAGLVEDRRDGLNVFYAVRDVATHDLIEHAKRLCQDAARAEDRSLNFALPPPVPPERCNCPKCAQRIALPQVG